MKTVPLFAMLLLTAPAVAQEAPPVPFHASTLLSIESAGRPQTIALVPLGVDAPPSLEPVCETPCTLQLDPGSYRVSTRGRRVLSWNGELDVPPDGLAVKLRATSRARVAGGAILTGLGAAMFAMGGFYTAIGVDEASRPGSDYPVLAPGLVMAAFGAVHLAIGIILLATTRRGIESTRPLYNQRL